MKFIAELNGKKLKTFQAVQIETIYKQYNAYCRAKKFVFRDETPESFGNLGWKRSEGTILLKRIDE